MPNLRVNINHKLGRQGAINRIKHLLNNPSASISSEISELKHTWIDNSNEFNLLVRGIKVSGTMKIENDFLSISGSLPILFYPLKKQIENIIKEHAASLLI
ncbi:polyhydroxyalkanoic acid system family protein [Mucilaginibacter sp. FT3.2]|uniref:polyhydroxyalkanoic acid system family protein n=1 Tax=Mucilaginibacter sp. FT3.2 TaxID=2723090 RepID=UPI00160F1CF4|nr:polyhydroxyalkanoic acid system family protein [Mucilaginibacter sp. FT3.2]MBB6232429.1 hypothetical protein [Mucilaginibacter sp. FT3.2]